MSLNSDFNRCEAGTIVWDDQDQMMPVPNALVWLSMMIDMGSITEKTAPEFYARVHMYESVLGPMLKMVNDDNKVVNRPITVNDVKYYIGLVTNVPTKTRKFFLNKLGRMVIDRAVGGRVSECATMRFPDSKVVATATETSLAP
jgi:hypothetical protein